MSARALLYTALIAALSGCATPQTGAAPRPASHPFTLQSWKLQGVMGCLGEKETPLEDGGVLHEFYLCGGDYSDARCRPWRVVPGEYLIARCTYNLKTERREERHVRYLRCDGFEGAGCDSDDDHWDDLGAKAPRPTPLSER